MLVEFIVFAFGLGLTALLLAALVWWYGRRNGLAFDRASRVLVTPPAFVDCERTRRAALRRVGAAMSASLHWPVVLNTVCDETLAPFEADAVEMWLLQSETGLLQLVAARGPHRSAGPRAPVPLAEAVQVAHVIRAKRTPVITAARGAADARWMAARAALARSALVVPLVKDNVSVRHPDLPVRFGGEEFALILAHTSQEGAEALARRVRKAAELAVPHLLGSGEPVPGYTLGLGVASFPLDAATAEDLVLAADYAERAAKRAGKNRVVAAESLSPALESVSAASQPAAPE